jgi:hypothetical protein
MYRCDRRGGWALLSGLVVIFIMATLMVFLLVHTHDQARADRMRRESVQALYDAMGQLELARVAISGATYDKEGRNAVVRQALESDDKQIAGTDVTCEPMTGESGSWYLLTARSPYDDGQSERVVRRAFRDRDYFSSYNLFVSDDPAGIAGTPVGAIHTNRQLQFYFPGGVYRHAVTAVGGAAYRAGATADNTTLAGPFNANIPRIELNLEGDRNFGFQALKTKALPGYRFPANRDVKITLERQGGDQKLLVELYSQPRIDQRDQQIFAGFKQVNPHEVTQEVQEKVVVGQETKTRWVDVDEWVEVPVVRRTPVYRTEMQDEQVPIYRQEQRTRAVPVYATVTKTRQAPRQIWVEDEAAFSGGTAIGGDGGKPGHWETVFVEESYQEQVVTGTRQETYQERVFDHFETRQKAVQVLDHWDEVPTTERKIVKKSVKQEYQEPIYNTVTKTVTKVVFDLEPQWKTIKVPVRVGRQKVGQQRLDAPPNGVVYVAGNVIGIGGDVVGRLTIASENAIRVTGSIVYRDANGDPAFLNGANPALPYEANPDYDNHAILGLIARKDLLYTTDVPNNFEINASLLSLEGRVGIDGVVLDKNGEVAAYDQILDEFGDRTGKIFTKTSIRRLGGVTTCRRPVDTVVMKGLVRAGFSRGDSTFDTPVLTLPPPYFMSRPTPRFFATEIAR